MTRNIRHVDEDTQQQFFTKVEKDDEEMEVTIHACTALDTELRSAFHEEIDAYGTEDIDVTSTWYRSNQGNELRQEVTLRFPPEVKLQAVSIIEDVVEIGREYYALQLERKLADEDEDGHNHRNQQLYFNDDDVKEFCLLYRGYVDI